MQVTFLGTGTSQGVPVIGCSCEVCASADPRDNRLRSSVWVQVDGLSLVIDTGPDFRQQMLQAKVKNLDAVLFTHEHKDHLAGLDDIRAYNFILRRSIDVYATPRVQEALKRDFHYIFAEDKYPGVPDVDLHTIGNAAFEVGNVQVQPIEVLHYRLPVLGFRIGDFTYITDANYIPDEEKEKIYGSKVLVLNALRRQKHISHFTLEEALEVARELNPETTYFTHISHQLGTHEQVARELPSGVGLAYDGLTISL
ncbi:MAG: MBL fold metallo-hydrolase [Salibacteraceae bacterium]